MKLAKVMRIPFTVGTLETEEDEDDSSGVLLVLGQSRRSRTTTTTTSEREGMLLEYNHHHQQEDGILRSDNDEDEDELGSSSGARGMMQCLQTTTTTNASIATTASATTGSGLGNNSNHNRSPQFHISQSGISYHPHHHHHHPQHYSTLLHNHHHSSSSNHHSNRGLVISYNDNDEDDPEEDFGTLSLGNTGSMCNTLSNKTHNNNNTMVNRVAKTTCLRPKYSLRTQLFLSFGIVTVLSVVFVMATAIVTTREAGERVVARGVSSADEWVIGRMIPLARYMGEILDQKHTSLDGLTLLLSQATQDRLRGYPNTPGYQQDTSTPFYNQYTQQNQYPGLLQQRRQRIPFDWQIPPSNNNTNEKDKEESFPGGRSSWYQGEIGISSDSPVMLLQGTCDPTVPDKESPLFLPNCSVYGLSVQSPPPTRHLDALHRRCSEYAPPFLKALYEYHTDIQQLGLYLVNEGVGASIVYPGRTLNGTKAYRSNGCEWIAQPHSHPLDPTRPILSFNPESASSSSNDPRQQPPCRPRGTEVGLRYYNPLEMPWSQQQALDPTKMHITGPYHNVFTGEPIVTMGRSIYDDITQELVGFASVDIRLDQMNEIVKPLRFVGSMVVTVVTYHEGVVVAAAPVPQRDGRLVNMTIGEYAPLEVTNDDYDRMKRIMIEEGYHKNRELPSYVTKSGPLFVSLYPLPKPPKEYDPNYEPQLMMVFNIDESLGDSDVEELQQSVDDVVNSLQRNILIAGFCGVAIVMLALYVISLYMTMPMKWINGIGDNILASFGSHVRIMDTNDAMPWAYRFSPETEITRLVQQFRLMVEQFSGRGTAKIFKRQLLEVKNPFALHRNFRSLYRARQQRSLSRYYTGSLAQIDKMLSNPRLSEDNEDNDLLLSDSSEGIKAVNVADSRIHWGHNVHNTTFDWQSGTSMRTVDLIEGQRIVRSRLFWWIVCVITFPLLCTLTSVSFYVLWEVWNSLPAQVESVQELYVSFERFGLGPTAQLRGLYMSEIVSTVVRDLFLYNRFAGWLYFGALQSFPPTLTAMDTFAESCKGYSNSCPALVDSDASVCDCAWNDPWTSECRSGLGRGQSRTFQRISFEGLNQNAETNGDRVQTNYPNVATDPFTTSFWANVSSTPGGSGGANNDNQSSSSANRYETTHDRLETLSALSVVQMPLYNYGNGDGAVTRTRGLHIGFEADGMIAGYAGCRHAYAYGSMFQSTQSNGAAENAPEHCPLGKYG